MTSCILITVDCLRADRLGCYGYQRPTTPNIDSLVKRAVMFTNAFSNGPYTTASFPSICGTSLSLRYSGEDIPLSEERPTLAEILKQNGYLTAAIHSNPYLSSKFGYARGFDKFEDFDAEPVGKEEKIRGLRGEIHGFMANLNNNILNSLDKYGAQRTSLHRALQMLSFAYLFLVGYSGARAEGDKINEKVISWLRKRPNKFFVWLHYMDVHSPRVPPREFQNRFCSTKSIYKRARALYKRENPESVSREEVNILSDFYDAAVCYVDKCIGDLVAELKAMEIYDDSLVIITADHGEEFNEHGGFTHGWKLYDELLHVPLIVKMPDSALHQEVQGLCSLIDLGPTILDVLEIPTNLDLDGASLLPMIRGKEKGRPWILALCGFLDKACGEKKKLISLRTERWKYIFKEREEDELYNLLRDPRERKNIIKTDSERAETFKSKLIELRSRIHYAPSSSIAIDEKMRNRLRALGYF